MGKMRLDKLLANAGVGTRSQVKQLIRKGCISVNGEIVKTPEAKADSATDNILANGKNVFYTEYEYYMFHKPAGYVTATQDRQDATVMDLLEVPQKEKLFPVGRLDKDTEGLLLITDDGALAHELLSPKKHVDKTYFVRVSGTLLSEHLEAFTSGIDIGDKKPTLPARLNILSFGEISEAEVTIREGRFHQIKRMFAALGFQVLYLKRLSMGSLRLDAALEKGRYRKLTEEELEQLKDGKNRGKLC
ncbi:pseudouridine synthase [Lachnospiraceae bacterium 46-15]